MLSEERRITGGQCRCGRVRLQVRGELLVTMACHCTGCQRMTGSAFSLSSLYRKSDFEVTAGEPVAGGLHGAAQHMFCPHCMSWHFTRPKGMDVFVNVRATMLDNARAFVPFIETYTVEMLPWARTPAVPRFERFPPAEAFPSLLAQFAQQSSAAVGSGRTE